MLSSYEQTFKRVLSFKALAKANLRDIDEELIAEFIGGLSERCKTIARF